MKLTSMTDFVLEHKHMILSNSDKYIRISKYAKFLKQPLKLEMFIPCDKDGNVLEEPTMEKYGWYSANHQEEQSGWMYEEGESEYNKAISKYRKAKTKVLFKVFDDIEAINYHISRDRNIEYLSKFGSIELTQNATKQFL